MHRAAAILEQMELESLLRSEADAQRDQMQELHQRQERIRAQLALIPPRYREAVFEHFEVSTQAQRQAISQLKSGGSCILFGPNGTGKTMLGFCAIRHQIEQERTARYILAADYFDLIRQSFHDPQPQLQAYAACSYLVIDEVDKRYGTPTEFIALYRLINHRYNYLLPTVLISNAGREELVEVIGASTFDRIAEDGEVFFLDGPSRRRLKRIA